MCGLFPQTCVTDHYNNVSFHHITYVPIVDCTNCTIVYISSNHISLVELSTELQRTDMSSDPMSGSVTQLVHVITPTLHVIISTLHVILLHSSGFVYIVIMTW
ncbi:hypothetical protein NP493_263g01025 [Ridgeia piscesae]|uniref:Uncharacterized protein n=1 Tax=Ridgeia piscesae TaxID=27915 RepID=A0AAD9NXX5_RIDPI|nr:hypothetical protein NP493_263g01025 [Ridgeia piscesae]